MTGQVYLRLWRLSWIQLSYLHYVRVTKAVNLLGSSFVHFLICEWNSSYDIMLLSAGVSWRYEKFEIQSARDRFNWIKLHVPPRTGGITAHHVQYRMCRLLVFVHWAVWVTEWAIETMLQAARYGFWTPVELKCPDRLLDHPASYSKGTGIFPWG